jgi:hypothetical protein
VIYSKAEVLRECGFRCREGGVLGGAECARGVCQSESISGVYVNCAVSGQAAQRATVNCFAIGFEVVFQLLAPVWGHWH